MKGLRRILLRTLTVLPLLLALATAGLWVRSYSIADSVHRTVGSDARSVQLIVYSAAGGLSMQRTAVPGRAFLSPDTQTIRLARPLGKNRPLGTWRTLGFFYDRRDAVFTPPPDPTAPANPNADRGSKIRVGVPYWFLTTLFAAGPTVALWRRWRRPIPGHCPRCGYDTRANPAKCSECGYEPMPAAERASRA